MATTAIDDELQIVARMVVDALSTNRRFGVTVIVHPIEMRPSVDVAVSSTLESQADRRVALVEALIRSGGPIGRMLEDARKLK
jgi:hypothetical protein